MKRAEAAEEARLLRVQKNYIELEMRKFKRRKLCSLHELENQLLRDVSGDSHATYMNDVNQTYHFQELSKKQQQLENAHSMLLRHHEKTQDLEYQQQKSVHALREDQVNDLIRLNVVR